MATKIADPTVQLANLAREVASSTPDIDRATDALLRQVNAAGLSQPLVGHMVRSAARQAVEEMKHRTRAVFVARASRRNAGSTAAYEEAVSILDAWHVGNVRLGDAMGVDLKEAAEDQRRSARGNLVRAAFYESLAAKLKQGQKVRDAMDDAKASELLAKAEASV